MLTTRQTSIHIGPLVLGFLLAVTLIGPTPVAKSSLADSSGDALVTSQVSNSSEPLFSRPTFLPLRETTRVTCVFTNCRPLGSNHHGFWAIDFVGSFGDPIYASGHGVAYVGGRFTGCRKSQDDRRGNWVWVDHGAGLTSQYRHLKSISIKNGQRVTPNTKLGTMGSSGDVAPCRTPYLHFEINQTIGQDSERIEPPPLYACHGKQTISYPNQLDAKGWDNVVPDATVRSDGSYCVGQPDRAGAPANAKAQVLKSLTSLRVTWDSPKVKPELVSTFSVATQPFHPKTNEWGKVRYHLANGRATELQVNNLKRRATYRVSVAALDPAGASPWAKASDVIMAAKPNKPIIKAARVTNRTVDLRWKRNGNGSRKITQAKVGIAKIKKGEERKTKWRKRSAKVRVITWSGLRPGKKYVLKARYKNVVGYGRAAKMKIRLPK